MTDEKQQPAGYTPKTAEQAFNTEALVHNRCLYESQWVKIMNELGLNIISLTSRGRNALGIHINEAMEPSHILAKLTDVDLANIDAQISTHRLLQAIRPSDFEEPLLNLEVFGTQHIGEARATRAVGGYEREKQGRIEMSQEQRQIVENRTVPEKRSFFGIFGGK